tara:strand:+ start:4679 stop:6415 length:1737 start_codon:yes stop_codon:yes gene_type:complete
VRNQIAKFICLLVVCCFAQAEQLSDRYQGGPYDRVDADFVLSTTDTPPINADWQPIRLPHLWKQADLDGRVGWYRFSLSDQPGDVQQAVYLWRFSMNIAVWINGDFLGDGGRFSEPVARNWNRPFFFRLPQSAWHEGQNYLYVKLMTYPNWGNLTPLLIGPASELLPLYKQRFFWQILMSQATFYISIITALVAFSLLAADRSSALYGWFGLSCLAWGMYSINLYIQEIPVSAKLWWSLVHSAVDWYGVTLALFAHRLMNIRVPALDRTLLAYGAFATLTYLSVDLNQLSRLNSYFHFITLCIVAYLLVISLWQTIKTRQVHTMALAFCMAIVAGFGAHDFSMNAMINPALWQHQFFWLQFSAPILMLTMLVILAYRFVMSFREQVNAEQRVRIERERIYSDIHDDVGSRVLSLVYSAETDAHADLAREALREIRAIVAGGSSTGGSIVTILKPIEAEARERFSSASIEMTWALDLSDERIHINDTFQYHLQRILRELVSNTIKHAHSKRVDISVQATEANIVISFRDYGCGFDAPQSGTGIGGVSRRVADLKGIVEWQSATPGCCVNLQLPFNPGDT